MKPRRTVFFVSDRTGITAEMVGRTLLTQFPGIEFHKHTLPFVDTLERAREAVKTINEAARLEDRRPIVLSTLMNNDVREALHACDGLCLDLFAGFINRLEDELGMESSHALGLSHGMGDELAYQKRIDAINYALAHDDGLITANYHLADVILIGVSRAGKTPTCLYLAMQYGVRAANYPLTPDDFERGDLPKPLQPHRERLYGLTISPERLARIRNERKPDSRYASLENCRQEVRLAEDLMKREGINLLDSTSRSVEEISSLLLQQLSMKAARKLVG